MEEYDFENKRPKEYGWQEAHNDAQAGAESSTRKALEKLHNHTGFELVPTELLNQFESSFRQAYYEHYLARFNSYFNWLDSRFQVYLRAPGALENVLTDLANRCLKKRKKAEKAISWHFLILVCSIISTFAMAIMGHVFIMVVFLIATLFFMGLWMGRSMEIRYPDLEQTLAKIKAKRADFRPEAYITDIIVRKKNEHESLEKLKQVPEVQSHL